MHPSASGASARTERSHHYDDEDFYDGSPLRFTTYAIYCLSIFLCAGAWNVLAAIYSIAEERFDVGVNAINWVSLSTFITYLPGSIIALWVIDRWGLRVVILIGMSTQLVMNAIKCAALMTPALSPKAAYWALMSGQILGGVGQPLILNIVTRVTMDWFPSNERDIATTLAFQSSSLGSIVFSLLPPAIVKEPSQVVSLMEYQLIAWALVTSLAFAFLEEKPEHPPSPAAAMQWAAREKEEIDSEDRHENRNAVAVQTMVRDFKALSGNSNYMFLVTSFSLVQGLNFALPTLVGQMLEPCGFSAVVAGNASAVLAGACIAGQLIVAPIMQTTKRYWLLQVVIITGAGAAVLLVFTANVPANLLGVYLAWGAMGLLQGPLSPLTLEHGAELTYPTSPENAASFLTLATNLCGFVEIITIAPLLALPVSAQCTSVFTPAALLVLVFVALGVAAVYFVREDNRRVAAEAKWEAEEPIREVRRSMDMGRMAAWERRASIDSERQPLFRPTSSSGSFTGSFTLWPATTSGSSAATSRQPSSAVLGSGGMRMSGSEVSTGSLNRSFQRAGR